MLLYEVLRVRVEYVMAFSAEGYALQVTRLLAHPVRAGVRGVNAPSIQARNAGQTLQEAAVEWIFDGLYSLVDALLCDLECLLHDFEYTNCYE